MINRLKNSPLFYLVLLALVVFVVHFWSTILEMIDAPEKIQSFIVLRLKNVSTILDLNWKHFFTDISLVSVALVIEIIFVGWEYSSLKKLLKRGNKSLQTDVFFFVLAVTNSFKFLSVVLTFGIFYFAFGIVSDFGHLNLAALIPFPWLQILVLSVISEFTAYWAHRLSHKFSWWWAAHRFHHSAEEMGTLTYYRVHFLESQINQLFRVIPFVIFGAPLQYFVIYYIITELHNLLIHSEIKSDWGWVGKYLIISPLAHRIHHSNRSEHYHSNYSNFLTVWDRLFGTFIEKAEVKELGLSENPYNQKGIFNDLWIPYKDFVNAISTTKSNSGV